MTTSSAKCAPGPVEASRADIDALTFLPVSENAEGLTVLGRVEALVRGGCLGAAGMGGCVKEIGHGGDHASTFMDLGKEILVQVDELIAERDALKAKLLSGVLIPHDLFDTIEEHFAERADVADGPEGPVPDANMQTLNALREAK